MQELGVAAVPSTSEAPPVPEASGLPGDKGKGRATDAKAPTFKQGTTFRGLDNVFAALELDDLKARSGAVTTFAKGSGNVVSREKVRALPPYFSWQEKNDIYTQTLPNVDADISLVHKEYRGKDKPKFPAGDNARAGSQIKWEDDKPCIIKITMADGSSLTAGNWGKDSIVKVGFNTSTQMPSVDLRIDRSQDLSLIHI